MSFESELEKRSNEQIESLKDQLAAGQLDPMQYHRTCGAIQTFRMVIDMIPEINKTLNER